MLNSTHFLDSPFYMREVNRTIRNSSSPPDYFQTDLPMCKQCKCAYSYIYFNKKEHFTKADYNFIDQLCVFCELQNMFVNGAFAMFRIAAKRKAGYDDLEILELFATAIKAKRMIRYQDLPDFKFLRYLELYMPNKTLMAHTRTDLFKNRLDNANSTDLGQQLPH